MQWSFTSFHKQNFCAIQQSFSACKESQDLLIYSRKEIAVSNLVFGLSALPKDGCRKVKSYSLQRLYQQYQHCSLWRAHATRIHPSETSPLLGASGTVLLQSVTVNTTNQCSLLRTSLLPALSHATAHTTQVNTHHLWMPSPNNGISTWPSDTFISKTE